MNYTERTEKCLRIVSSIMILSLLSACSLLPAMPVTTSTAVKILSPTSTSTESAPPIQDPFKDLSTTPLFPIPTWTLTPTAAPLYGPTPPPPSLPADAVIVENEGAVCFQVNENWTGIRGSFSPRGCYSSSCTLPGEVSFDIQLDQERYVLRFFTRFVLFDPIRDPAGHECTADCAGGGAVDFNLGELDQGTYSIWMGDKKIGELYLPFTSSCPDTICYSSDTYQPASPTLTATPVPPTPVTPYPAPVEITSMPSSP